MFVDWTLMLFILVSAFIYTSAYVDPANLTGKQTLLITISSVLRGQFPCKESFRKLNPEESGLLPCAFIDNILTRSILAELYICNPPSSLYSVCWIKICMGRVTAALHRLVYGHHFKCILSRSGWGKLCLFFQEKSRGWRKKGQFSLQQSDVLPPSHWSCGATQNQLPDSR